MLEVKLLTEGATLPSVAHPGEDLAYDLYASKDCTLFDGATIRVPTGVSVQQEGFGFIVKDRSSLASKGLHISGGVIDPGYTGEIQVIMTYLPYGADKMAWHINKGDKIAQMVPVKAATEEIRQVSFHLTPTARGEKGFGSSGK